MGDERALRCWAVCLQVNAHHLAVLLPRVHLSGVRTHPLLSLLPSRSRQGSVGSYRRLYQAHRGKMPNMSDGRHMPTVSNNCDVCVWCVDGSCDFCDTAHALREPCALEQGLGHGPAINHHQILVDGVDIDPPSPIYYDVLISANFEQIVHEILIWASSRSLKTVIRPTGSVDREY